MQSTADITSSKSQADISIKAWGVQRTQNYSKVLGFEPYDLAICALLDSYYPRRIKYYLLNLDEHQKNLELANKVMREVGIEIIINNEQEINENNILKQLKAAQKVLEPKLIVSNSTETPKIVTDANNAEEKFESEIKRDQEEYAKEKRAEKIVLEEAKKDY